MIPWLDFWLFGNGHGMSMPHHDGILYCIAGRLYKFSYGLGAQIEGFQWFAPRPGARLQLLGREFEVCSYSRSWWGIRVMVAWGMADAPRDLNEHHQMIADLKHDLDRLPYHIPGIDRYPERVREEEER